MKVTQDILERLDTLNTNIGDLVSMLNSSALLQGDISIGSSVSGLDSLEGLGEIAIAINEMSAAINNTSSNDRGKLILFETMITNKKFCIFQKDILRVDEIDHGTCIYTTTGKISVTMSFKNVIGELIK